MATEQVQQWITRDMKLSKVVSSFESDFATGLLFGEILHRYGLVEDMTTFSKKTGKDAKVQNFQQVEQKLRELKVKFDGKTIHQIMNEERGAALRLLYQMKLAIEKANLDGIAADQKTMTNLRGDVVQKKLEETQSLSKSLPTTSKLSTVNHSTKLAPIEKGMLGYEYRKLLLEQKALTKQKEEEDLVFRMRMDAREEGRRKLEENKEFMDEWMTEGKKNWKLNQKKRADAIARVKYFEDREIKAYKDKLNKELDEATGELIGGVDEFERNLQKLGIEKNTNIEEAMKRMEEKKGVPPGQIQNFSYAATMNKIKEKKNVQDFAAKERDRRRRKMVVDQAKTQSELDRKRNEELLIEKLLAQQGREHKMAYLDRRAVVCKELVVETRRVKAQAVEEKRKKQLEELEWKRSEAMPELIAKHKADHLDRKKEFSVLRREEKAKKRSVNIEICSEVLDLIVDIANEAFDESKKSKYGKIEKPMWREWMRYFKDNKLVSRARRGLLNADQETFIVTEQSTAAHEEEQLDIIEDTKKPIEEVLDVVRYEQPYNDLLEYLGVTGIFNLTDGRFKEWEEIQHFITRQQGLQNLDLNIFFDQHPPLSSSQIGSIIQRIVSGGLSEKKGNTANGDEEKKETTLGIPHYLTLKLCLLGKACAGKRTVAKQIQELYPAGKVKIFRMDDLIKEVVEYVSPKPVADAGVQDKGKKAPPPKGKVEETAPVDPYAGMDTREYKEIGAQIKKHFGEGELPSGQDLTALIPDEALLVNLFIQKLKLAFPQDKSEEAKIEEIKANLAKEEQLLEQLAELEAANAAGGDPSKGAAAKGAKAPPAKGKGAGGPSGEEQIRAELDAVTKVQPEGWILLDFPRTLKQAKAMENLMIGFTSLLDESNQKPQSEFEQWSKIVQPTQIIGQGEEVSYNGEPFFYRSGTDGYLFIEVPSEECIRRVSHRKIDPTTGTVYHMEDNPPPEGDPKLKDRLQDYAGEPDQENSRVSHHHQLYNQNSAALKKWAKSFCLKDEDAKTVEGVNLFMEVYAVDQESHQRFKKEEVFERVQKHINKIIGFKQEIYDFKKNKVRLNLQVASLGQEQVNEGDQKKTPEINEENVDNNNAASRNDLLDIGHTNSKQSGILNTRGSRDNLAMTQKSSSSTAFLKANAPLSETQKRHMWKQFEAEYYRECLQVFKAVAKQRGQVFEGLTHMQAQFIDTYLGRIDTRQTSLIQDFIDSFNKFSDEFPNLRADPWTQEELRKRVTKLSNDLWILVEQKKDQALSQHDKLNSDGWVVHEMKKLMKNACRIIQVELQRYFILLSLATGTNHQLEVELERTLDNYSDDGMKTIDEHENSPLFDAITAYVLHIVALRREYLDTQNPDHKTTLLPELDVLVYRLNLIRTWVMLKVREFNSFWRQLYRVLDDGIVTAVRIENEATQSVIHKINEHLDEQISSGGVFRPMEYSDFRIPYLDLESQIERIDFSSAEVPLYMQQGRPSSNVGEVEQHESSIQANADIRFAINSLSKLYESLRYYAYEEYLEVPTLIHVIVLFSQQGLLPLNWKSLNFEAFSNNIKHNLAIKMPGEKDQHIYDSGHTLHRREFCDWRKFMTMVCLIGSPLPSMEDVHAYEVALKEKVNQDDGYIKITDFAQVPAWFDDFESVLQGPAIQSMGEASHEESDEEEGGIKRDYQRLNNLKCQLFKIHQSNIKLLKVTEFIQTLKELVSLVGGQSRYSNYNEFLFNHQE